MTRAGMQRQAIAAELQAAAKATKHRVRVKRAVAEADAAALQAAATVEAQAATATDAGEPAEAPATPEPRQWNGHDAQALLNECNALLTQMAGLGAKPQMAIIEASAGAFAALRILVVKGIVTEVEAECERLLALRNTLRQVLLNVEADVLRRQREAQQGPAIVTPPGAGDGLLIARR